MLYTLEIRTLVLAVHLGWPENERREPQEVAFSVALRFQNEPAGCESDELDGSICYAQVSEAIAQVVSGQEFKLIEALGKRCFTKIKQLAGDKAQVRLEIHKLNPPVRHLRGGSLFTISEFS